MRRILAVILSLPFVIAAAVIALYALGGFVVAPWYIKKELPNLLKEHLQATGSAGDVRINPFLLSVEVRDFAMTEAGGKAPVVAFDRLFVDFETSSLFRRAWTFDDITLEKPHFNLIVDDKGALNLTKLKSAKVTKPAEAPKQKNESAALPRLLLHKVALVQGEVTFTDLFLKEDPKVTLNPIDFALQELSTLPDQSGDYSLQARLPAGGTLAWKGKLTLTPIASSGRLDIKDLKIATLWQFVQDKVLSEPPDGAAHLSVAYNARYHEQKLEATANNIAFKLNDVALKPKGLNGQAEAVLTIAEAGLNNGTFNFAERKVQFAAFELKQWSALAALDEQGRLNWQKLFVAKEKPPEPAGDAWNIGIDTIAISDGKLRAVDQGFVQPLALDIAKAGYKSRLEIQTGEKPVVKLADMTLELSDIRIGKVGAKDSLFTLAGINLAGGNVDLSQPEVRFAKLSAGKGAVFATLDANGLRGLERRVVATATAATPQPARQANSAPPGKPLRFAIDAIDIPDTSLRVVDARFVKPVSLDVTRVGMRAALKIEAGAQTAVDVNGINVNVNGIKAMAVDGKDPLATLASITLANGTFSLAKERFSADSLKLVRAVTSIKRAADGQIDLLQAFAMPAAGAEAKPVVRKANTTPISINIGLVELTDSALSFEDRSTEPPLAVDVQNLRLAARKVDPLSKAAMPVEGAFSLKQGGAFSTQGTVTPATPSASLRVELKDLALAIVEPLVTQHTTLKLKSGAVGAAGQVEWSGAAKGSGSGAGVRYSGKVDVADLRLDDATGERLLAWKQLAADGIEFNSTEKRASVADLLLAAPSGKILIAKDKSTNFSSVMRKPAGESKADGKGAAPVSGEKPAATPAPTPGPVAADDAFVFGVERVRIDKAEVDFSDQSLVLPFAAPIRDLSGAIIGISSRPGTRATVRLDGRVDEFGEARVSGSINLLEPKVFTDITVAFRNVAMSPLTPYSATFAGRRITSGKLSLDLQYKLNNSQLSGENKVLLEQFTLGERVESPTAVNLPLDLAIALLTDGQGRIDLSVPVRGNVDNPDFAYGALVWQAIRIVLTNIVTAPFRALASLFGGNSEKVDAIAFTAGSAQLAPPEREKLTKVAGVLKQRPQLKLGVEGRFDPKRDAAVLRADAARRALAVRAGFKLTGDDDPALVNYDHAKTQREIEAMMEERAGSGSVDKFKATHEKITGKPVSRVNAALALIGRGSSDRAFYEALFQQVITQQPLDNSALANLATRRGAAVTSYLSGSAGVEAARVSNKPAAPVNAEKDTEVSTALTLDVGK